MPSSGARANANPDASANAERSATADAAGFVAVADLEKLRARGSMVVKRGKKQIVLFASGPAVYACNNRCPHEGYPLSEGTLSHGCLLTCNWHNWKFDLESGETLVGSDNLRRYPVRLEDGKVWLDLADPPAEARAEAALAGLRDAFERHDRFREYEHMARELARFMKAGGDPLEAVRQAVHWAHDRLEFGTSHAVATAADWLTLRAWKAAADPVASLAILTEVVGHFAWDCLREPVYPYPEGRAAYQPRALVAAIEAEDEAAGIAQVRGALAAGLGFAELEPPLAEAALAHYADFGHSAIYVVKTGQLIARLGPAVAEPLLLALVRSLIYAFREDLIPEFRDYGPALEAWPQDPAASAAPPGAQDFIDLATPAALARARDFAADPEALHRALLGAAAWHMLHFDRAVEARNDGPVQDNVGWLDFTHAITFANAVRNLCERHPRLWPQGLLQMACFLGRNAPYVDRDLDVESWRVGDAEGFLEATAETLLDHGQSEYILSAHLLKTFTAVREEVLAAPGTRADLLAGLNRLMNTPIKRKFTLRVARQSLEFVARED
ncbi:MAG: Rieske 2Fe-2S domain-containing protein [Proteobacteria bacterium]|nr:Rieske 2Fe-2S domain-containing protein [Pseudomonadota bacterium]